MDPNKGELLGLSRSYVTRSVRRKKKALVFAPTFDSHILQSEYNQIMIKSLLCMQTDTDSLENCKLKIDNLDTHINTDTVLDVRRVACRVLSLPVVETTKGFFGLRKRSLLLSCLKLLSPPFLFPFLILILSTMRRLRLLLSPQPCVP